MIRDWPSRARWRRATDDLTIYHSIYDDFTLDKFLHALSHIMDGRQLPLALTSMGLMRHIAFIDEAAPESFWQKIFLRIPGQRGSHLGQTRRHVFRRPTARWRTGLNFPLESGPPLPCLLPSWARGGW